MHPFPAGMLAQEADDGAAVLRPQDVFAILTQPAHQMQSAINSLPFSADLIIDKDRVASSDWSWRRRSRSNLGTTLASNTTAAETSWPGYSGGNNRVAYALRQQAKFYVEVPYVGSSNGANIKAHGLGVLPGLVIFKGVDITSPWIAYARASDGNYNILRLNTISAAEDILSASDLGITSTSIKINAYTNQTNVDGSNYVALLFAHDTDPNGIIQCGSFTEASGTTTVNLGWQPQLLLTKTSSAVSDWIIQDAARGFTSTNSRQLFANNSGAEDTSIGYTYQTANGFALPSFNGAGTQWIYLAIRAPIT